MFLDVEPNKGAYEIYSVADFSIYNYNFPFNSYQVLADFNVIRDWKHLQRYQKLKLKLINILSASSTKQSGSHSLLNCFIPLLLLHS